MLQHWKPFCLLHHNITFKRFLRKWWPLYSTGPHLGYLKHVTSHSSGSLQYSFWLSKAWISHLCTPSLEKSQKPSVKSQVISPECDAPGSREKLRTSPLGGTCYICLVHNPNNQLWCWTLTGWEEQVTVFSEQVHSALWKAVLTCRRISCWGLKWQLKIQTGKEGPEPLCTGWVCSLHTACCGGRSSAWQHQFPGAHPECRSGSRTPPRPLVPHPALWSMGCHRTHSAVQEKCSSRWWWATWCHSPLRWSPSPGKQTSPRPWGTLESRDNETPAAGSSPEAQDRRGAPCVGWLPSWDSMFWHWIYKAAQRQGALEREGSKDRAQMKLENRNYHWHQSWKTNRWQESISVQKTNYLSRTSMTGMERRNIRSASHDQVRCKPSWSAQLDWTPRNTHCASVPSPVPNNDILYPFHLVLYPINKVTLPSIHLCGPTYSLASHSKIQPFSL